MSSVSRDTLGFGFFACSLSADMSPAGPGVNLYKYLIEEMIEMFG